MTLVWLVVLVIYGFISGWSEIPVLSWLLLVVFFVQDDYDLNIFGRSRRPWS